MFKWAVFAVMWIAGLFAGDVLAASGIAGIGSRLVFFGGMWMLACIAAKECIAKYQGRKSAHAAGVATDQPAGWHVSFDGGLTWEYHADDPWGRLGERVAIVRPLIYGDGADWRTAGVAPAAKQWPFAESPGEFTERLRVALNVFEGDLLAAVRNVLIENPPTIAGVMGTSADQGENQRDRDAYFNGKDGWRNDLP